LERYRDYQDIDDVIRMCRRRIRVPDQWYGDYLAMLGAALTAADIVLGGVLAVSRCVGVLAAAPASVLDYLDRLQARLNGRVISVEIPDDLPPVVCDYAQIDQVVTNLLENAILHTPPGTSVTARVSSAGAAVRVEHFQTAVRHGEAVGAAMAGVDIPFLEVPWFWSDQYDLSIQYVGAGLPWDEVVVRGRFGTPPFTAFYLEQGRLRAAAGVNDGRTVSHARRLLATGVQVDREILADRSRDLKALAKQS